MIQSTFLTASAGFLVILMLALFFFAQSKTFLLKPRSYIKGTKMAYAGLRKDKDRASVILYLNDQSDSPLPRP